MTAVDCLSAFGVLLPLPTNPNGDTRDMTSSPQPSPPEEERETAPAAQWFVGAKREASLRGVLTPALSLGERVNCRQSGSESEMAETFECYTSALARAAGQGRGEGN